MMPYQQMPHMVATRTESGLGFLVRFVFFILFIVCAINTLALAFGKMDLVSWFTGFTVKDRDSLNLFIFYLTGGSFLLAVSARWYKLLWWLVVVAGLIFFFSNFGRMYFIDSNGPSMTETMSKKFNFNNIPRLNGAPIPFAGGGSQATTTNTPPQQLAPVTGTVSQGVTQHVGQQSTARQKAQQAQKKAVNHWTNRFKKEGFLVSRPLNQKEQTWCKDKAARLAFKNKHPKREWIAEGRCVTKILWEKK